MDRGHLSIKSMKSPSQVTQGDNLIPASATVMSDSGSPHAHLLC